MLVFTRRANQSLMIGDNIEITVLSVTGDQIRVGIEAPREIPVHRKEVYQAIARHNELATQSRMPSAGLMARLQKSDAL